MKLKEIKRTAIQSWSPAKHHPIFLATGTSMQRTTVLRFAVVLFKKRIVQHSFNATPTTFGLHLDFGLLCLHLC